jgi:hypothetical protein
LEVLDNRQSLISELHDIMTDFLGRPAGSQMSQGPLLEAAPLVIIFCNTA